MPVAITSIFSTFAILLHGNRLKWSPLPPVYRARHLHPSPQAVPEADAGPNAYLVKDVEEWMTNDEDLVAFLLSRLEIQASTSCD